MNRIIHFELTADDTARAQKFYEDVFAWEVKDSGMPGMDYRLIQIDKPGSAGINGAIMPKKYHRQATINTIGVDDLKAAMAKVTEAGGKIAGEVQEIPGVGSHVYATDTEGNLFGMMQAVDGWQA